VILTAVATFLVGYFIGAINPAAIIARLRGVNLRTAGSGNPGATNAGRVLGRRTGILVGLLDVLKASTGACVASRPTNPIRLIPVLVVAALVFGVSKRMGWLVAGALTSSRLPCCSMTPGRRPPCVRGIAIDSAPTEHPGGDHDALAARRVPLGAAGPRRPGTGTGTAFPQLAPDSWSRPPDASRFGSWVVRRVTSVAIGWRRRCVNGGRRPGLGAGTMPTLMTR
jgi:hypothetical protein